MGGFFLVFFITLAIGFPSMLLAIVIGGILFFGRYAPFPVPGSTPTLVANVVQVMIALLPGLVFVRFFRRWDRDSPGWGIWLGGFLALGITAALLVGLMSFGVN